MGNVGKGALAVIVALALLAAVSAGSLVWRYVIAEPRGKVEQEEILQRGQNRIAQYDMFFDRCASVQEDEATIAALREELQTGPPESRRTQVFASITALKASRAGKIAQYNVDARKVGTTAQFRSSDLPFQLDPSEEVTVCFVQ